MDAGAASAMELDAGGGAAEQPTAPPPPPPAPTAETATTGAPPEEPPGPLLTCCLPKAELRGAAGGTPRAVAVPEADESSAQADTASDRTRGRGACCECRCCS